jgi:dihydroorotate dehydrogenase electron transfer subunit
MVWAPEAEEIPLAVSGQTKGNISITIDEVGPTSRIMCSLNEGDQLGIRGPYGKGFDLESGSKYLLVGSGCGVSPLNFAVSRLNKMRKDVQVLIDARSDDELCFLKQTEDQGIQTYISTHDGSKGFKGYGSELAETLITNNSYDFVLSCGPEKMMKAVHQICSNHGIKFQASLERYMRCGFGLCGSCSLDPLGLLVCQDGPVFDGNILSKLSSFGNLKRERNGSTSQI